MSYFLNLILCLHLWPGAPCASCPRLVESQQDCPGRCISERVGGAERKPAGGRACGVSRPQNASIRKMDVSATFVESYSSRWERMQRRPRSIRKRFASIRCSRMPIAILAFCDGLNTNWSRLREALLHAVELSPDDSFAHYYLGRVGVDAQQYEQAVSRIGTFPINRCPRNLVF